MKETGLSAKVCFSVYTSKRKPLSTQTLTVRYENPISVLRGNKKNTPEHGGKPCSTTECGFACSKVNKIIGL